MRTAGKFYTVEIGENRKKRRRRCHHCCLHDSTTRLRPQLPICQQRELSRTTTLLPDEACQMKISYEMFLWEEKKTMLCFLLGIRNVAVLFQFPVPGNFPDSSNILRGIWDIELLGFGTSESTNEYESSMQRCTECFFVKCNAFF